MNCQTVRGNPIYDHPVGQIPTFLPKIMQNMCIMQITAQFGPFDNAKWPQHYI
jgi:hypothetical protein